MGEFKFKVGDRVKRDVEERTHDYFHNEDWAYGVVIDVVTRAAKQTDVDDCWVDYSVSFGDPILVGYLVAWDDSNGDHSVTMVSYGLVRA